jgi:hypothetical protein
MNLPQTKFTICLTFLVLVLGVSCKKDEEVLPPADKANVSVTVYNSSGTSAVNLTSFVTNPLNISYRTDLLKYIISNIKLVREDGTEVSFPNVELINQEDASSLSFNLADAPNGNYTAMRFVLGLDSLQNATLVNGGDLDPSDGMVWTWNTGYIFLKHEGRFIDSTGTQQPFFFHYGTNRAYTEIEVPIENLTINGEMRKLRLNFDLSKMYSQPNPISYFRYTNQQSLSQSDIAWIALLKENLKSSFSAIKEP